MQLAVACCVLAGAPASTPAAGNEPAAPVGRDAAQRGIELGFADPGFLGKDAELRGQVFNAARRVGAGFARVPVGWASVAKTEPVLPADPGDPSYDWSQLDRAVNGAGGRGMKVLMTIHQAPEWAEGPGRPTLPEAPAGTWRPNAQALGEFAAALARRYDGTYVPRLGRPPLPRVAFFEPLERAQPVPVPEPAVVRSQTGQRAQVPAAAQCRLRGRQGAPAGRRGDRRGDRPQRRRAGRPENQTAALPPEPALSAAGPQPAAEALPGSGPLRSPLPSSDHPVAVAPPAGRARHRGLSGAIRHPRAAACGRTPRHRGTGRPAP